MMSGLNDVLGNVYGTAADKPQETNLEDVKESMDALLEHADKSMDAPASESTTEDFVDEEAVAPEQPEAFDALPAEISDDWVPGGEDPIDDDLFSAGEEIGFDDDSGFVASATPAVDDEPSDSSADVDAPGTNDDMSEDMGLLDLFEDETSAGEDFFAGLEPEDDFSSDQTDSPDEASSSWLQDVDVADDVEGWMDDFGDIAEPAPAPPAAAAATPTDQNADNHGPEDEAHDPLAELEDGAELDDLADLADFELVADDSETEAGEALPANVIEQAASGQDDDSDLLDESDEAWLDDLFSVEGIEAAGAAQAPAEPEAAAPAAVTDAAPTPEMVDPPAPHETSSSATVGFDVAAPPPAPASVAGLEASGHQPAPQAFVQAVHPESAADERPFAIAYSGWVRVDDDILPKKSGRGTKRSKKSDDVAIQIDTSQIDLANAAYRTQDGDDYRPPANSLATAISTSDDVDADDPVHLFSPAEDEPKRGLFSKSGSKPKAKTPKKPKKSKKSRDSNESTDASNLSADELELDVEPVVATPAEPEAEQPPKAKRKMSLGRSKQKGASPDDSAEAQPPAVEEEAPKKPKKGLSFSLSRKPKKSDAEIEAELLAEVDAAEAAAARMNLESGVANSDQLPEGVADPLESALMKPPPSVEG